MNLASMSPTPIAAGRRTKALAFACATAIAMLVPVAWCIWGRPHFDANGLVLIVPSLVFWIPAFWLIARTPSSPRALSLSVVLGASSPIVAPMFGSLVFPPFAPWVMILAPAVVLADPLAFFPIGLATGLAMFAVSRLTWRRSPARAVTVPTNG